jgi:quercetin dioxygenase-like cupin family protein
MSGTAGHAATAASLAMTEQRGYRRISLVAFAVLFGLRPAVAEAQKVTVEIDNAWVRTSRVNLAPQEKLPLREYPASVVVYLTDARESVTGRKITRKTGETAYFAAGPRTEENISGKPLEEVVIEFKPGAPPPNSHPITLDPVKLDPKFHTVDFENERVRVLRTVLEPHIKSPMHEHPPYVVVYVTELHTTMALNDGRVIDNVRKRGEVAWRDAMQHSTENIGNQRAMEIQVELKP